MHQGHPPPFQPEEVLRISHAGLGQLNSVQNLSRVQFQVSGPSEERTAPFGSLALRPEGKQAQKIQGLKSTLPQGATRGRPALEGQDW
jgi:hypothetical protein